MNPAQLTHYLTTLVEKKILRSVMVWGPPGIGKSDIVKQIGNEQGRDVIDVRLSLWESCNREWREHLMKSNHCQLKWAMLLLLICRTHCVMTLRLPLAKSGVQH